MHFGLVGGGAGKAAAGGVPCRGLSGWLRCTFIILSVAAADWCGEMLERRSLILFSPDLLPAIEDNCWDIWVTYSILTEMPDCASVDLPEINP